MNEGDTFFLPKGSDQIYYSNPDNNFERIWINFKGKLAEWEKAYKELHDYVKDFLYVMKLAPERVKNFISDIIKEFTDRRISRKNKNIEQDKER